MRFKTAIVGTGKKEAALEAEEGQQLIARLCERPVPTKEIPVELPEKLRAVRVLKPFQHNTSYQIFSLVQRNSCI